MISFKTISGENNLKFIEYCEKKLTLLGAKTIKTYNSKKTQANLFSTIGKDNGKGIILSGHSDVVPAISSDWTPTLSLPEIVVIRFLVVEQVI